MATASRSDLDPRQLKAREEFQKMREQLRRTQERTPDPALARDRMKERIAFYERDARLLKRPLAAIGGRRWWRQPATIAVIAFALGAVSTFAAMAVVLGRGDPRSEPLVPAGLVADQAIPAREPAVYVAAPAPAPPPPTAPVSTSAAAAPVMAEPAAVVMPAPETTPAATIELAAVEPAPIVASPVATPSLQDDEVVVRVNRIRESQTLLAALGYVPGRADGDPGPQTVAAAAQFAAERGLQDSNLDAALLAALRAARAGALPVRGSNAGDETVVERVDRIREIQTLLVAAGYELGRPDGDAGPVTLAAAADYAQTRGLLDANLDAAFLAVMREGAAG